MSETLDDIMIFDDGETICFFDKNTIYKIGDPICVNVEGKDQVYLVYSIPEINTEEKTYYARRLV